MSINYNPSRHVAGAVVVAVAAAGLLDGGEAHYSDAKLTRTTTTTSSVVVAAEAVVDVLPPATKTAGLGAGGAVAAPLDGDDEDGSGAAGTAVGPRLGLVVARRDPFGWVPVADYGFCKKTHATPGAGRRRRRHNPRH